jgi:hypothetical protein
MMVTNPITRLEEARALKTMGMPVNVTVMKNLLSKESSSAWIDPQDSGSHLTTIKRDRIDCRGLVRESWACIDCAINTASGCSTRVQLEQAFARGQTGVTQTVDDHSEIYMVKPFVWKAAGMEDDRELWDTTSLMGGCLCIGCLEKRLGRNLVPKDFMRHHPFRWLPGTERLLARRDKRGNRI